MKLLQFAQPERGSRLGLVKGDEVFDLTACAPHPASLHDLYYRHGGNKNSIASTVEAINIHNALRLSLRDLLDNTDDPDQPHLISPVTAPTDAPHKLRIWLAGVTHEDSAKLREIEAKQATGDAVNVYDQKYRECAQGGTPELFAKNDTAALVGHGGSISHPHNTQRLVPETELVTIYGLNATGQIERLGYTGGNDYTDNGIEAENPLNLPQAKNWSHGCASLGPLMVTNSAYDDSSVAVSCEVIRNNTRIAYKKGHTGQNHLNMPDGLFHLERSLFSRLPLEPDTLQILYWGTPIVFSDDDLESGLCEGDHVCMTFEGIGPLENPITAFPQTNQLQWLDNHR
ncbi:MAG: fumarylacetoacetate hydrolase family protein [Gemmatimonadetes bacterium]|nr:fumarylacetoacetate hydrolase family protein [Gemmatimonadota bacterium]